MDPHERNLGQPISGPPKRQPNVKGPAYRPDAGKPAPTSGVKPVIAVALVLLAIVVFLIVRPPGPTALCRDGTLSESHHRSGTCSHHHGVKSWIHRPIF
jgi:hypothetical protein